MRTPKPTRKTILEATKTLSGTRQGMLLLLDKPTFKTAGRMELTTTPAEVAPTPVDAQRTAQRETRRQGLRMLMGLNAKREGGPVDGLQCQEEQRTEW